MLLDQATIATLEAPNLAAYFNQIVPYFAGGEEALKVCRPTVGLRLFFVVQFNEFKN